MRDMGWKNSQKKNQNSSAVLSEDGLDFSRMAFSYDWDESSSPSTETESRRSNRYVRGSNRQQASMSRTSSLRRSFPGDEEQDESAEVNFSVLKKQVDDLASRLKKVENRVCRVFVIKKDSADAAVVIKMVRLEEENKFLRSKLLRSSGNQSSK